MVGFSRDALVCGVGGKALKKQVEKSLCTGETRL